MTTRLVPSPNGPARKYYHLTPTGRRALADGTDAWERHAAAVGAVLSRPLATTEGE